MASNFLAKLKNTKVHNAVVYDDTSKVDIRRPAQMSNEQATKEQEANEGKTYTVDDAIEKLGFGWFQIKLAILAGCAYMSDSMEMMVLSVLGPALSCDWDVTEWQKATMTVVIFVGMGVSSPLWGRISDKHGRKIGLLMSTFFSLYFGILSSVAPTLIWLMILRSMVGFGVGGAAQAFTMFSEFSPKNDRAKCSTFLSFFWPIGACLEVVLAILIMPTLGWRYLLGFTSIPLAIFGIFCFFLPESARYYQASGQNENALKVLERVAKENKGTLPEGKLISPKRANNKVARMSDLFSKEHRFHTIYLWIIWFSCTFSYYGIVLLTTELLNMGGVCSDPVVSNNTELVGRVPCSMDCLKSDDYLDLLYTTISEFPGLAMTVFLVDILGRRKAVFYTLLVFAVITCLLNFCLSRTIMVIIFFVARCCIASTFQAIYIYTPEYYPTPIRAIGLGTCSAVARVGAIITPFVSQVLLKASPQIAISLYAGVALLSSFLMFLLPETKGKNLDRGDMMIH